MIIFGIYVQNVIDNRSKYRDNSGESEIDIAKLSGPENWKTRRYTRRGSAFMEGGEL
jgi:hypothetical protein